MWKRFPYHIVKKIMLHKLKDNERMNPLVKVVEVDFTKRKM